MISPPDSVSARHQDPGQVSPGRRRQEELPRRQRPLRGPGRQPGHTHLGGPQPAAAELCPAKHRPGDARLAGCQRHGHRGPVGGSIGRRRALRELGDRCHPAAGRRQQTELRRPRRRRKRQVVRRELPPREGVGVRVQHRLRAEGGGGGGSPAAPQDKSQNMPEITKTTQIICK